MCPCGGGRFEDCCGPVLDGRVPAATAEALMRSRFAAFAKGRVDYLLASWAPETRPTSLELDPLQRWQSLEIIDSADGLALASTGVVEFVARFGHPNGGGELHERSTFRREAGKWVYVSAITPTSAA